MSLNGVNEHLVALQRKGMIERSTMLARGIVITQAGHDELHPERVALRDVVDAGPPMLLLSAEDRDDGATFLVDPAWACGFDCSAAWISTSTIAAKGIFPGALVTLAPATAAPFRNGDVALVRVDDDSPPVLRQYRRGNNCHFFDADDVLTVIFPGQLTTDIVLGRAVSIYRSL